jgi:hypothetical protein
MRRYTEIITTELFTDDEQNTNGNNNNNYYYYNLFLGICKCKDVLFSAIVERKNLPSVVTVNEQLVLYIFLLILSPVKRVYLLI